MARRVSGRAPPSTPGICTAGGAHSGAVSGIRCVGGCSSCAVRRHPVCTSRAVLRHARRRTEASAPLDSLQETRRRKRPITWLRAVACAPVAAGGRKSSCRQTWQSTLGPATQRRTTGRKLAEVGEARTTAQFSRAQRRQRQRLALPCLCSLAYLRSCSSTAIARHHHLSRGTATHARTLQLAIALAFLAVSILGRAAAPAARARPPWGLLIPQVARVVGRPRGRNAVGTQLRTVPERRRHAGPPRLGPRLWPPVHRRRVPRHHRALPPLGPPEHRLAFDTEQRPVHLPRPYAQPPSPLSPPRLLLRSAFPLTSPSCRRPLTYASGANAIRHPGLDSRNPSPS